MAKKHQNKGPAFKKLSEAVLEKSQAKSWYPAVFEWEIAGCTESPESATCVCGQKHIRYLFTIHNTKNEHTLFPIGSSCINRFGRKDLTAIASIFEQRYRLLRAFQENKFIKFDSELFSRNLLGFLFEDGAFRPSKYNEYDPYNDYKFLIDMFNAKKEPSKAQQSKINALLLKGVLPYLERTLSDKVQAQAHEPEAITTPVEDDG